MGGFTWRSTKGGVEEETVAVGSAASSDYSFFLRAIAAILSIIELIIIFNSKKNEFNTVFSLPTRIILDQITAE